MNKMKTKIEIFEKQYIKIINANKNNLKNITVKIPINVLCGISGVSGSGKSTLINQTLTPLLKFHFGQKTDILDIENTEIFIPKSLKNIIIINQEPIGKTPRSNPVTYIKVFDEIRNLYSKTKQSKILGFKPGRFSFNTKGGRCEHCKGDGVIKIEMNFLPDVYVTCEICSGKRYNLQTLEILYKSKNISQILAMDINEAVTFFENHTLIHRKLQTLQEVGLGYIKLGQSSTTLSGGEAQRIKLTKELSKFKKGNTLYILDEPTTGLHFEDVKKLINVLNKLVDKKNSVIVIEHNLDVLKSCDYIIDLGLDGGKNGGEIIAEASPEELIKNKKSYTAKYLKPFLK